MFPIFCSCWAWFLIKLISSHLVRILLWARPQPSTSSRTTSTSLSIFISASHSDGLTWANVMFRMSALWWATSDQSEKRWDFCSAQIKTAPVLPETWLLGCRATSHHLTGLGFLSSMRSRKGGAGFVGKMILSPENIFSVFTGHTFLLKRSRGVKLCHLPRPQKMCWSSRASGIVLYVCVCVSVCDHTKTARCKQLRDLSLAKELFFFQRHVNPVLELQVSPS